MQQVTKVVNRIQLPLCSTKAFHHNFLNSIYWFLMNTKLYPYPSSINPIPQSLNNLVYLIKQLTLSETFNVSVMAVIIMLMKNKKFRIVRETGNKPILTCGLVKKPELSMWTVTNCTDCLVSQHVSI